jgi:3-oxoacyl-[acyl-carrier-protein] synthase-3
MAVPETVVTNAELSILMDTSDEWIQTRTGIAERRLADPGVGAADLGAEAGAAALADAGLDGVDALVVATMTPDYFAPGAAPIIQERLGLGPVPAFDLRQQCSGFVYALDLADSLMRAGKADTVLVVGTEVHAGWQPWLEAYRRGGPPTEEEYRRHSLHRNWAVLFGDGAGAVVLARDERPDVGIVATTLATDGAQMSILQFPALGSRSQPIIDAATIAADAHLPDMEGGQVFRQAVQRMPESVRAVAAAAGIAPEAIDLVIAHQANARILAAVEKALGLPAGTVPVNIDRYGNTTAGTLPILFHELRTEGRVGPGAYVCFTAFGAGTHWGAALYREPPA